MSVTVDRVNHELMELSRDYAAGRIDHGAYRSRRRETIRWLYQSAETLPKFAIPRGPAENAAKAQSVITAASGAGDLQRLATEGRLASDSHVRNLHRAKNARAYLFGLIAVVVVIAGGAAWLLHSDSKAPSSAATSTVSNEHARSLPLTEQVPFDMNQLDQSIQLLQSMDADQRNSMGRELQNSTLLSQLRLREETLRNLDSLKPEEKNELEKIRALLKFFD